MINHIATSCRALVPFLLGAWLAFIAPAAAAPGDADSLNANVSGTPSYVYATAIQPDGKIIIGGAFSSVQGVTRNNIARLNSDGTLDTTFNPKTNGRVDCVAVQADGKILMGGQFTSLQPNGAASATTRNYIARANADGTLDTSFDPRANSEVYGLAIQTDGKILLSGNFTSLQPNGASSATTRNYIARINSDGSLDTAFNPRANNSVYTMAVQSNGSVILGGAFTTLQPNGAASATTRNRIARVLSTGALDTSFNPNAGGTVYTTALEPDGQILLGGAFTTLQPNGAASATTRNRIARLNTDGTLDATFNPNAASDVYSLAIQADGGIILGGNFIALQPNGAASSTTRNKIARVLADGSLDTTFNPSANSDVLGLMLQNDGLVLTGGNFGSIGGLARGDFARLANDPPNATLGATSLSQVDWQRTGSAPEVTQVSMEVSTNGGGSWTSLGNASRVGSTSSWRLTGLSLPNSGHIRARGRVSGGYYQGSSGVVEQIVTFGPVFGISGNGVSIANGDNSPSTADGTDLGAANLGTTLTKTFTLTNTGLSTMVFIPTGASFSGPNASDFAVHPGSNIFTLGAGGSYSFQVNFTPSGEGPRTATMTFATNDPAAPTFTCTIQGTGWATSNADLSALSFSPGTLNNPFTPNTLSNSFSLPFWEDEISVTPVKAGPGGSIEVRVNGGTWQPVTSGAASPAFELAIFGGTNVVEIRVTSADATTAKTYVVNIVRGMSQSHYVHPADWSASGAGQLRALAYDSGQGSTLIGGAFTALGGVPRTNLARVQTAAGANTIDASFNPSPNGWVHAVAIQSDGKILVAGQFTEISPDNGISSQVPCNALARLYPDGTLDTAFHPFSSSGAQIEALMIQPDGKILIAGLFDGIHPAGDSAATQRNLARLHPDGTVDLSFDPQPDGTVASIALQSDGKVVLGGNFQNLQPNGSPAPTARSRIARVNADGTLDASFSPAAGSLVSALAMQADGRILVGGAFVSLQGTGEPSATTRHRIARLNPDGTVDAAFDPKANGEVSTIAVLADNSILFGGQFTTLQPNGTVSPVAQNRIARVYSNGSHDSGFNPNPDNIVLGICTQEDGRIQICGGFTSLQPAGYPYVSSRSKWAMLYGNTTYSSLVAVNHTQADWTLSSFTPEISSAYLEHTDGSTVTPLGAGTRVGTSNTWRFSGVNFPNTGTLRAWGRTAGGQASGSVGRIHAAIGLSGVSIPEIAVSGNSVDITTGDITPSSGDHTDLGPVLNGLSVQRTFTISNLGTATLSLSGTPVFLSGPGASAFAVTFQPPPTIPAGGSAEFTVSFTPASDGLRSATVTIGSNDFDEGAFAFEIQGTGVADITPAVSTAATDEDTQSSSGLVVSRNATDTGGLATHFKITGITGGALYQSDGVTTVANGVFLAFAEANAGLRFTPAPDFSGSAGFNVQASTNDNDSGLRDGVVPVTVTVAPVNDPPSFTIGGNRTHPYGTTSSQSLGDGATGISDGDPDFTQALTFNVSNDNTALFTVPPAIAADGTLTYTPAGVAGTAVVSVSLTDDATAGGAALTSAVQTFTITLDPASNDSSIASVSISVPGMTPAFSPEITSYTATAAPGTTGISITPASGDGNATMETRVNGGAWSPVTSGNSSGTLPVGPGLNVIELRVTAQDGSVTTYTFQITVPLLQEIALTGNNTNIANGDANPDTADHTDFGSINIAEGAVTRTFTLSNSGDLPLSLTGTPTVQITGAHAADFSVTVQPVSPVAGQGNTTFTVSFDPAVSGTRTAELVIASDDADENPFTFSIRGEGAVSNDSTLSSISLTGVSLTPAFHPEVTSYAGSVPGTTSSITLTASGDSHAVIEVRVAGGSWSPVIPGGATVPLDPGANNVEVRVTAQAGGSTTYTLVITRAAQSVGLDTLNPAITGTILYATAVQPDGKILIGGSFSQILGTPRQNLARLNADGTLDSTFNPKPNSGVYCISIQNDGKILIGGNFTTLQPNGAPAATTRNRIARLNANGTLDTAFDPNANGFISCILPQPDGKILLGGSYGTLKPNGGASVSRAMLARVNADGTLDSGFAPTPNSSVDSLVLQPDGKIVLGGIFTTIKPNGAAVATARQYLARINADGTLDNTFIPNPNNRVHCVVLQPDGKILLCGMFTAVEPNGVPNSAYANYIARVNADGSLDAGFDPNGNTTVTGIALQADGRILLGGQFTTLQPNGSGSAVTRNRIARTESSGALDPSFTPLANNAVNGVSLQADGKIHVMGTFTAINPDPLSLPVTRNLFARLNNDSASQSLTQTGGGQLDWVRGGAAPEVTSVWFEQSTDGGTNWTPLGEGTRVGSSPDWRITGLSLPGSGLVRARGRTAGGYLGGSSGIVETSITLAAGLTDLELWRQTHFGSTADSGDAANHNDFDHDGTENLLEFAFGSNPTQAGPPTIPQPVISAASLTWSFTQPANTGGIVYQAEWSETMAPGDWHPIPDTGSGNEHVFSTSTNGKPKLFTRLLVSEQ